MLLGLLFAAAFVLVLADGAAAATSASGAASPADQALPAHVGELERVAEARVAAAKEATNTTAAEEKSATQATAAEEKSATRATAAEAKSAAQAKAATAESRTRAVLAAVDHGTSTHDHGTLFLLQPNAGDPATFVGHGGYSADGLSSGSGGLLQADVPAGSTVYRAYLYGYFLDDTPTPTESTVDFDGTSLGLTKLDDYAGLSAGRADVTAQVSAKVGSGGGIFNFSNSSQPSPLAGLALLVIFSNPLLPETTIAVLDGSAQSTGDTATFSFAAPLDTTVPGFAAQMSLGIGFSYQQAPGHVCGPGAPTSMQYSTVDVNGVRLTSCAGNFDDGSNLLTVGGVGDVVDNPTDPFQSPGDNALPRVNDDELYDLEPFLNHGDNQLVVTTAQPSNDDILFLAVISVTASARVTTEVCDDGIDNDGDGLLDGADIDCPSPPEPPDPQQPPGPVALPPVVMPGPVVLPPTVLAAPPTLLAAPPTPRAVTAPSARPAPPPRALARTGVPLTAMVSLAAVLLGLGLALEWRTRPV